jgi:putative addiction module antidote
MFKTRIRKIGNSVVITLTDEMLAVLCAHVGDAVYVVRGDDGSLKILPHDPELAQALAAAQIVMDENYDMLQALA